MISRYRHFAWACLLVLVLIAAGCARKTRELTPEEALRKEVGVRRSVKNTNQMVNQVQFFDENGLKIEEQWYNPNGVIITSRKLKYDNQTLNLMKVIWYKGLDIQKSKNVFEYDSYNRLVSEETLTPFDDRKNIKYFYYDNGNIIKEVMEGSRGGIRYKRFFSYENGNLVEFEEKNDDGEITNRQTYKFDADDNMIKQVWYYDKGYPVVTKEHAYTDGRLKETVRFNEEQELEYRIVYRYNIDGLLEQEKWVDSEGNTTTENIYTYNYH